MKYSTIPILFITYLLTATASAGIIPIAARYDGAGGVYGAAYETNISDYKLTVGGVTGDANAFGGMLTKYFSKDYELSAAVLSFSDVSILTTYDRNLTNDEDSQYLLNIKGSAVATGSKLWLMNDLVTINFSATQSTVKFDDYQDEFGDEIDLAQANLFDVETLSLKVGFDFNFLDVPRSPTKGVKISTSVNQVTGRTGQSDQMILDYGLLGMIPLHKSFSLITKARFSDAVIDINKKYDSEQEIRDQLDANCSSITSTTEQAKCQKLENALVAYILKNNLRGTASPLGGSSGLRSFREQRFKATHTAIYTAELHTNLSQLLDIFKGKDTSLNLVVFYDQGFANDDKLELFDESRFSNGVALQLNKGQGAIKLQVAGGSNDTNSWSLTFGKAF
jgi:hypothetical protein